MIAYIKGKVLIKKQTFLIIERQGIGYKIFVSSQALDKIHKEETIELFTHFSNRNEQAELYGFSSFQELEIFEALEKISGVGPKAALSVASLGNVNKLKQAVETQNFNYFSIVKGLGKKKIQKIILELGGSLNGLIKEKTIKKDDEALKALMSLGFSATESRQALLKVPNNIISPEKRVQEALKFFN